MFLAATLVGWIGDSVYRKAAARNIGLFDQFRFFFVFLGFPKSALIATLKTPAGSICFTARSYASAVYAMAMCLSACVWV